MLGSAALTLLMALPVPAGAVTTCDRVASADGSDTAAGTAAAPFKTAQKLVDSLSPGQTGCVRGTLTGQMWINRDAITVASEPGQRGKVIGKIKVQQGADGVTVRDLDLDGRSTAADPIANISPTIYGNDAAFVNNDITNGNTAICIILGTDGHDGDVEVQRTRLEGNRIHNCGRLPRTNMGHAIYVEHSRDARIVGNEIFDNADRGIQLYPNSQGTLVAGNVIDGNGVGIIFSGVNGRQSNDNTVRHNLVTNPQVRSAIESWYPEGTAPGTGNVVEQNCVFGGTNPISTGNGGFTARDNRTVDPQYVDRAAKNFSLQPGSPCAEVLAAGRAGLASVSMPPISGTTPTSGTDTDAAPVVPAGTSVPKAPKVNGATKRPAVRLSLRQRRYGNALGVNLRLVDAVEAPVRTLVEVRYGKRGWRPVAVPRLQSNRSFFTLVKMPRKARRVLVRASVIDPGETFVARLSLTNPRHGKRF